MNRILVILFLGLSSILFIQENRIWAQLLEYHNTCMTGKWICFMREGIGNSFESEEECLNAPAVYYKMFFYNSGEIVLGTSTSASADIAIATVNDGEYTLYGPFDYSSWASNCEQISLGQVNSQSGVFSNSNITTVQHVGGFYILKLKATSCPENSIFYSGYRLTKNADCLEDKADCQDCISSFSPDPGQYLISAWTKGEVANRNKSYENPGIAVSFVGAPDSSYFAPSGKVIDDWQRIEGVVTVPPSATDIKIGLYCQDGDCYFDDIRFVPLDGGMVSYVYDPVTLRLVAELDERNYATFYEYDEEGKLVRVKKETERGIMTIQENRESLHKP